ncbi:hypothetical protein ACJMK2_035027 [Sinanodonta woodiana]|uniref:Uncharacterized protein n=1 Tax=Sinanodonta woodiana TaxID=1069815 RepID=A0ABD3WX24_SINWO
MKPMHILFANFSLRKTCLCTKHQNIALKIRCLRGYGMQTTKNPDMFIKEFSDENVITAIDEKCPVEVKFFHWKWVKENDKMHWKEVQEQMPKEDFKQLMKMELSAFRDHVERLNGHILVWMDSAENFVCSSVEEIQSAYWNTSMISLHTMVSIVAISDLININATAVHTILRKTIPVIKADYPALTVVHYLSDSPTSQYRNRYIFQFLAYHEEEFSIKARWNFLESGYGKGPCDGLGGSVKRSADMAVRQAKCNIQDAADFYAWGLQSEVYTRNVSCYCLTCMTDVETTDCACWELHALSVDSNKTSKENMQVSDEHRRSEDQHKDHYSGNERQTIIPKENDFIAAIYDKNWYIGRVTNVDETEVMINFMCRAGKYDDSFKWPTTKDKIWLGHKNIISIIDEPVPHGKTKRLFKIPKEVIDCLEEGFVSLKDGL